MINFHKLTFSKSRLLFLAFFLGLFTVFTLTFSDQAQAQLVDLKLTGDGTIKLADEDPDDLGAFCDDSYLLGIFPPWNRGIDCNELDFDLDREFQTQEKTKIIIGNITSIVTRLAGLVAVVALIVAGFKYVLSQGNSQKAAGALKSIIHALSGLALAVAATLLVETIHQRLTGTGLEELEGGNVVTVPGAALPTKAPAITEIIGFVMLIIGLISVLMIVLQGMRYALSQGNTEKTAAARNGIIYSLVGAAVALTSWSFVQFVLGRLVLSDATTSGAGVSSLVGSIIGILVFIVGVISVIMVIIGGYQYIFSGGDTQKASSARGTIIYSLVGVAIAIFAGPTLTWILQRI